MTCWPICTATPATSAGWLSPAVSSIAPLRSRSSATKTGWGLHGNTQVPKLLGSLTRFAWAGEPGDGFASAFFWDRVVQHHSYATGGHGKDEYFGEPDKLSNRVDGR